MIEYRIEVPSKLSTVKNLWRKFLKGDKNWHFTLEGTYVEIRVTRRIRALDQYLKQRGWNYTTFIYLDNVPITRKYQIQYEKIFHGLSELAMVVRRVKGDDRDYQSEVYKVIERCVHLSFNVNDLGHGLEASYLAGHAINYAYSGGRMAAFNEKGFDVYGNPVTTILKIKKEKKHDKRSR